MELEYMTDVESEDLAGVIHVLFRDAILRIGQDDSGPHLDVWRPKDTEPFARYSLTADELKIIERIK